MILQALKKRRKNQQRQNLSRRNKAAKTMVARAKKALTT